MGKVDTLANSVTRSKELKGRGFDTIPITIGIIQRPSMVGD